MFWNHEEPILYRYKIHNVEYWFPQGDKNRIRFGGYGGGGRKEERIGGRDGKR